jgi:Zn-finger nucleic acid-binding protein
MWIIECPICDIDTEVQLRYGISLDEIPRFCPMCGSDIDAEEVEDYE